MCQGYLSAIQAKEVFENADYETLEERADLLQGLPQSYDGYLVTIDEAPVNWDPERYGHFVPCKLLKMHVPSRHQSNKKYWAIIMFTEENHAVNRFNFHRPGLNKILGELYNLCFVKGRSGFTVLH